MFSNWQQEKAILALIEQAQAMADKLSSTKPHIVDSHAAAAQFWAVYYQSIGQDLQTIGQWPPSAIKRFSTAAATQIEALRKKRDYDSSDGLAIWMHTARAVAEPRLAPAVREIWQIVAQAGVNADAMSTDMLTDASLPSDQIRLLPKDFIAPQGE